MGHLLKEAGLGLVEFLAILSFIGFCIFGIKVITNQNRFKFNIIIGLLFFLITVVSVTGAAYTRL